MIDILISSVTQGAVWAVMAIGVYITFRLLDIPDLTAEGTFPLGAAIAAVLMSQGVSPVLATLAATVGGALGGLAAGLIHTKMYIPPLLTGILVLTGLYSINLHVMEGRPNITLLNVDTIYTPVQEMFNLNKNTAVLVVSLIVLAIVICLLVMFLHTETGLALRSTGDNAVMSEANGINTNSMKTLGYMIGNGLIALSGAMIAQKDGYSDIQMGIGTIVIGLASVIIAEVILKELTIGRRLTTIILGSIIYRLIIDLILNQPFVPIQTTDLKLFSAILLALILYFPEFQARRNSRRQLAKANQGGQ